MANTDVDGLPYAFPEQEDYPLLRGIPFKVFGGCKYFGETGLNTGKGKNGMASGWENDLL
jgi:hypothetical protein